MMTYWNNHFLALPLAGEYFPLDWRLTRFISAHYGAENALKGSNLRHFSRTISQNRGHSLRKGGNALMPHAGCITVECTQSFSKI